MTFVAQGETGFALLAADGMTINGSESYAFTFRRVNLESSTFEEEFFSINFSGMGAIEGNEFRKPENMGTTLRFGGRDVPAGDYALVSRSDRAVYGTASYTNVNCYSLGAGVVRIAPGVVTIIPGGDVNRPLAASDNAVLPSQVELVLAGYPNITAPRRLGQFVGVVTFQTGRGPFGNEVCRTDGPFTYRPLSP